MATAVEIGPIYQRTIFVSGVPKLLPPPAAALLLPRRGAVPEFDGPVYDPVMSLSSPAGMSGGILPGPGPGPGH